MRLSKNVILRWLLDRLHRGPAQHPASAADLFLGISFVTGARCRASARTAISHFQRHVFFFDSSGALRPLSGLRGSRQPASSMALDRFWPSSSPWADRQAGRRKRQDATGQQFPSFLGGARHRDHPACRSSCYFVMGQPIELEHAVFKDRRPDAAPRLSVRVSACFIEARASWRYGCRLTLYIRRPSSPRSCGPASSSVSHGQTEGAQRAWHALQPA